MLLISSIQVPYITKFMDTIKAILRFYSHSSKRLRELSLASKILDDTIRKYGTWNPVRWIASKSRTMEVVNINCHLSSVATASNSQEASTAKGLVRAMTSVNFVVFLGFMCDFTGALSALSKSFQCDSLTLCSAMDELDATLGMLEQLSSSSGYAMSRFLKEFDSAENPSKFRGLEVTGGKKNYLLLSRTLVIWQQKHVRTLNSASMYLVS